MKRNKRHVDLVYRYLDGDLKDHELEMFRKELGTDVELQEELRFQEFMNKIHKDHSLQNYYDQIEDLGEKYAGRKNHTRTRRILLIGSAAIIVLLAATYYVLNYYHTNTVDIKDAIAEYDEVIDAGIYIRGEGNSTETGFKEYDEANYNESAKIFENTIKTDPDNEAAIFFLGLSYYESGDYAKAVTMLEKTIKSGNELFFDAAEWKLGLCYLQLERTGEAVAMFSRIVEKGQYKSPEAKKILELLK